MTKIPKEDVLQFQQRAINTLKENGVLNQRIADKVRLVRTKDGIQKYVKRILKEKKSIIKVYEAAVAKGIKVPYKYELLFRNLDRFTSGELQKEFIDIQRFKKRKADCIRKLSSELPPKYIELLTAAKTMPHINKILDTLPPKLLIDAGVMKTKSGTGYLTKKSVKAISTPMYS